MLNATYDEADSDAAQNDNADETADEAADEAADPATDSAADPATEPTERPVTQFEPPVADGAVEAVPEQDPTPAPSPKRHFLTVWRFGDLGTPC